MGVALEHVADPLFGDAPNLECRRQSYVEHLDSITITPAATAKGVTSRTYSNDLVLGSGCKKLAVWTEANTPDARVAPVVGGFMNQHTTATKVRVQGLID